MSATDRRMLIGAGVGIGLGALAVLVVLPAQTGWDPTGVGKALGLTQIADPPNPELERGRARMARQEVLLLSDTPVAPQPGIADAWEIELAPFDSIEFKYEIAQGERIAFRWQASAPVHYDLHSHPFDGGTELTESYAIGEGAEMNGVYIAAFTGLHGWYWQNRTAAPVRLQLTASGAMRGSRIFSSAGELERPVEGAQGGSGGAVAGHSMQASDTSAP